MKLNSSYSTVRRRNHGVHTRAFIQPTIKSVSPARPTTSKLLNKNRSKRDCESKFLHFFSRTGFVRGVQVQELRDHDAHVGEEAHECEGMHGHDHCQDGYCANGESLTWYPRRGSPVSCAACYCSLDWAVLAMTVKRQEP